MKMNRISATSLEAINASRMLSSMQLQFVNMLDTVNEHAGCYGKFKPIEWYRNAGKSGGGIRYTSPEKDFFNRGSVNFSQIQYETEKDKALRSATALSIIIHPKNPKAPSFHMHVSFTEMKKGKSYWRIMADLNPAIVNDNDKLLFIASLKKATGNYFTEGCEQGDRYFFIPLLKKHRGVSHFYLEKFTDGTIAEPFIEIMQNCYREILSNYTKVIDSTLKDNALQLAYHTLYFYQVLTLDRGSTSGLLIHNQNDIGILASLPSQINRELLLSWKDKMVFPQGELVDRLVNVLPEENICKITDKIKAQLATQVREHYKKHPKALMLQSSGNGVPTTVQNHQ
jgi:coproporphyrinogen III oxidase